MNSMSVEFCDTNILVYAYDRSAGQKYERARELVDGLWFREEGALRVQVLQEFFVTITRARWTARLYSPREARGIVGDLAAWRIIRPGPRDVLAAIDAGMRWQFAFWDAMVLTTAQLAGATVLWSEDLNAGQDYDGVVVRNPFAAAPPA